MVITLKTELDGRDLLQRQVKAFLDILVLGMLSGKPMHGYEILADIHRSFGVLLSPGTLYPLLHTLEEGELIEAEWSRGKRVYVVNSQGRKRLAHAFAIYTTVNKEMTRFINGKMESGASHELDPPPGSARAGLEAGSISPQPGALE